MRLRALRPSPLRTVLILFAIASLCFMPGCHQVTEYPPQPALVQTCDLDQVLLSVRWIKDVDDAAKACGRNIGTYGCASVPEFIDGMRHVTIYAQRPSDFNDVPRLAMLGHEVCHALGGKHE